MTPWLAAACLIAPHAGVRASLLCAEASIQPGVPFTVGVAFDIPDDWHIYWKNAGDTGLATSLSWSLPKGVQVGPTLWPTPSLIETSSGTSYGYEKRVILLTRMTAANVRAGQMLKLSVKADWLECKEECLPGSMQLSMPIKVEAAARKNAGSKAILQSAWAQLPTTDKSIHVAAIIHGNGYMLKVAWPKEQSITGAYFFPDAAEIINHSAKQTFEADGNILSLEMQASEFASKKPTSLSGVIRLSSTGAPDRAVHVTAPILKS